MVGAELLHKAALFAVKGPSFSGRSIMLRPNVICTYICAIRMGKDPDRPRLRLPKVLGEKKKKWAAAAW